MTEHFGVSFELNRALLGFGCVVIAVFPGGQEKRISFKTEGAARDWMERGAPRWLKNQKWKADGVIKDEIGPAGWAGAPTGGC